MSYCAVRTVTSGVQRAVTFEFAQSKSMRATAVLGEGVAEDRSGRSASSALQYSVVSIVCAGPAEIDGNFVGHALQVVATRRGPRLGVFGIAGRRRRSAMTRMTT